MSTKQEIVERLMKLAPRFTPVKYEGYIVAAHRGWEDACRTFAERLAETAMVVSGISTPNFLVYDTAKDQTGNTHTALLIDVQPIKKTDPLVEKLRKAASEVKVTQSSDLYEVLHEAADRIEAANE